ncbi:MAG TPA: SDR family oxidoreductase [Anaerovoracaceae bacterium]|nr:SDR family oxidoreductase [Anaerovoracaceae bacterium]
MTHELFDITGKKAIVTGAAQNLGKGIAEGLLEAGASVVIIDIAKCLDDTVAEFREKGYDAYGVSANIMNESERTGAFEKSLELLGGRIDILVNSAGVQRIVPPEDFPLEDWHRVIEINLVAMFHFCQLSGRVMLKQGEGKIINIASLLSFFGGIDVSAYAASKGGVAQLTSSLSNSWSRKGINVNAIAPGYMNTTLNKELLEDEATNKMISNRIPKGRWGTPQDLKGLVIFLSSKASDYICGDIIKVDGGYYNAG